MNPQAIIFAIQAGVRLGQYFNKVLIDKQIERPLVFPVGDTFADSAVNDAIEYFEEDHPELISEGGAYFSITKESSKKARNAAMVKAYQTLIEVDVRIGLPASRPTSEAVEIISNLHEIEQFKNSPGGNKALKGAVGLIIDLGIQYFTSQPHLLSGDSTEKKVLAAFLNTLQETKFSAQTSENILGDLFLASLRTLQQSPALVSDEKRTRALVGGVVGAFVSDFEANSASAGELLRRKDFLKRVLQSALEGAAGAFTQHSELFLGSNNELTPIVKQTVEQVLAGIKGKEDLFTSESVELILKSALEAVGEHSDVLVKDKLLQEVISNSVKALTKKDGKDLFSQETAASVLQGVLEAVRDNGATLLGDDAGARSKLITTTISAIAGSLSSTLAGGGQVKDLLSRSQLAELSQIVFQQVAQDPEALLKSGTTNARRTVLAQVIGSMANALGEKPSLLTDGEGFLRLVGIATEVALRNADQLVDLKSDKTTGNLLFKITQAVVTGVTTARTSDLRALLTRPVFLDISDRVLKVTSANLAGLADDPKAEQVVLTITAAIGLANGELSGRIDGANLPVLIEQLLVQTLWNELDLKEETAVKTAAALILRNLSF